MTWTARTLLTLLTTLLMTAATGGIVSAGETAPIPAPIETSTLGEAAELTEAQTELVAASFALFAQAGLAAPTDVVPSFHDSMDDCDGNLGLSTIEDGVSRVRVCWTNDDPGIERRLQEQALVHELAHAWTDRHVDDALETSFVELSGAESWNQRGDAWNDRGQERAADLITWALLDPAVLFVEFEGAPCDTWSAAYELLTGASAPSTLTDAC